MRLDENKEYYLCNFRGAGIIEVQDKKTLLQNWIEPDEKIFMHEGESVSVKELIELPLGLNQIKISENAEVTIKRIR
jgi:hypothetical protein